MRYYDICYYLTVLLDIGSTVDKYIHISIEFIERILTRESIVHILVKRLTDFEQINNIRYTLSINVYGN